MSRKGTSATILLIMVVSWISSNGQITVNGNLTPYQLASTLTGPGVSIFNIVYTGAPQSSGSFNAAGSNLGLNTGIVLTTGSVNNIPGPNLQQGIGTNNGYPGDTLLSAYADTNTLDAAILEFDFIPQNDTISFRYVFASDEYPEYVCSPFNDVFAFFLSGPGITGSQNIALIPGTSTYVGINSVNNGSPGTYGTNGPNCGLGYPNFYVDNTNGTSIEYDGFTTVFVASAIVVPCQTYHMKLAIADAGDGAFDSGVFFEAGSLSSTPKVYAGPDDTLCTATQVQLGIPPVSGWTYSWSPSTGLSNDTISNPVVSLPNATANQVQQTYIVTGTDGQCVLRDTVQFTILPVLTSTFYSSVTNHCSGSQFQVIYNGNADTNATYNWSFPGVSSYSGSGQGPYSLTYNTAGTYTVSLSLNYAGCPSTPSSQQYVINPTAVASFVTDTVICLGDETVVTFNGTAIAGATYNWSFGSATVLSGTGAGPYHLKWNSPGTSSVRLSVIQNGCTSTLVSKSITINPLPVATFTSPAHLCAGDTATITFSGTNSAGASYNWNFGTAQTLAGSGAGPYQIKYTGFYNDSIRLTVTENGCTASSSAPVRNDLIPSSVFSTINNFCAYDTIDVIYAGGATSGATYNWNLGGAQYINGNGQGPYRLKWNIPGTYNITLNVTENGCTSPLNTYPVTVKAVPVSQFTLPPHACSGDTITVSFTGTTTGFASFYWNFGNAQTLAGSGQGPYQLVYTGFYNDSIYLSIDDLGCKDSIAYPFRNDVIPSSAFSSFNNICVYDTIDVIYTGGATQGAVYNWNLGGAQYINGSGQGPYHLKWNSPGTYNITLNVSENGCTSPLTIRPVNVKAVPVSQFVIPPHVCTGDTILLNFTGITTGFASFNWNFGNAQTLAGSGAGPYSLIWNQASSDSIKLLINDLGCVDSVFHVVKSDQSPVASFVLPPFICSNVDTTIIFNGSAAAGSAYNWNFSQGIVNNGSGSGPYSLSWNTAGIKNIQLEINNNGCVDTVSHQIMVYNNPQADFIYNDVCFGNPVQFTDTSLINGSTISSYSWLFGDNNSSTQQNPLHQYTIPGNYSVHHIVYSQQGCVDSISKTVSVYPLPLVEFNSDTVCFGQSTSFNNLTGITSGGITNWKWLMDAQDSSFVFAPAYTFPYGGTFQVTLTATSDHTCISSVTHPVKVYKLPQPVISASPLFGCSPLEVNFQDQSIFQDGQSAVRTWSFGDGSKDSIENPLHTYSIGGLYSVSLHLVSDLGCVKDTTYADYIDVYQKPVASFRPSPDSTIILFPELTLFNESQYADNYLWNFGDGNTTNDPDPVHAYADTGVYHIILIATTNKGCSDTTAREFPIRGYGELWVPNAFTPDNDGKNDNFLVQGIGITDYNIKIFNRYGQQIYEADTMSKPWDGTFKNNPAQEGTYIYLIKAKDEIHHTYVKSGQVNIIR